MKHIEQGLEIAFQTSFSDSLAKYYCPEQIDKNTMDKLFQISEQKQNGQLNCISIPILKPNCQAIW